MSVVCFCAGTLIRTTLGEIAVENLHIGDIAVTAFGKERLIKWLGHRDVDCRNEAVPQKAWPIRIAAHAYGPDKPARDLYVSPYHRILVGDTLIPASWLANGATISQVRIDRVSYWHVELDGHGVLLANNLPAESYVENGNNRSFFAEADVVAPSLALPVMPLNTEAATVS